jgi:hypothetical protein
MFFLHWKVCGKKLEKTTEKALRLQKRFGTSGKKVYPEY